MILPGERGGWWHAYVCPSHGVELEHTGLLTGAFPAGGARCRHGCRVDSPAVRGAWTVLAHQACARHILELARSGEDVLSLLEDYAALYAGCRLTAEDEAQPWMLRGRLFHQALTEAIWAVTIGRAAWTLSDRGVRLGSQVTSLLQALTQAALQARNTLVEDGRFTSNYVAWLDAGGFVCSRDPDWLEGPHGLYAHLLTATYPDGWQWEGSTYYHSFVLRAAVLATVDLTPPQAIVERMNAMAGVLAALRSPVGSHLPALHDGPYSRALYDAELADLADFPAPSPRFGTTVYEKAGYALLRAEELQAVVDFGPHGGSHGHRDKLSLYLYGQEPWQPDPGQVPYGHHGWRCYYASTAAHPSFRIDHEEQAEHSGRLVSASDRSVTVASDGAYPGVRATRQLTLTDDGGLIDELVVTCDRPRRITAQLRPAVPLTVRDGSTYWGKTLRGDHVGPAEFLVRPGPGPADDPQRVVSHVDWTAYQATSATFRSTYQPATHQRAV